MSAVEIEYDQHQATLMLRNTALHQLRRQPDSVRNKLHRNYVSVHETKETAPMSEALKQHLMDYYRQDVAVTAELLKQDLLSLWYQN